MSYFPHTHTNTHSTHATCTHARTHTHTFGAVDKVAAVSIQESQFFYFLFFPIFFSGAVGELAAVSSEERRS